MIKGWATLRIAAGIATLLLLPAAVHYGLLFSGLSQTATCLTYGTALLQAVIYTALVVLFGTSLLPGHEPIITRIARITRGTLPEELETYTRRVTIAWGFFCAFQLIASAMLLTFAPMTVWAFYVTSLNLPLLAVMVSGEYIYRMIRWSHYSHESPADMMRLFRGFRSLIRSP